MRNKNRTVKGDALKEKHQATYEKWWLGKTAKMIDFQQLNPPEVIVKVEYVGNSVYGVVKLITESGKDYYVGGFEGGYRPQKFTVELVE